MKVFNAHEGVVKGSVGVDQIMDGDYGRVDGGRGVVEGGQRGVGGNGGMSDINTSMGEGSVGRAEGLNGGYRHVGEDGVGRCVN